MTNLLPYSISDIILPPRTFNFSRRRKAEIVQYLENRAGEFQQLFGFELILFISPVGFDYSKFVDTCLEPLPHGLNYKEAVISLYGERASQLIDELIDTHSNA